MQAKFIKPCKQCGAEYPVTGEFFYRDADYPDGFYTKCKACAHPHLTKKWERQALLREGKKRCIACKEIYPATPRCFHRGKNNKDGWSGRCRACSVSEWSRPYIRAEMMAPEGTKVCRHCCVALPPTSQWFGPMKQYKSGLNVICRDCQSRRQSEWRARPEQRERISAYNKERYWSDPEKQRQRACEYARNNPEKMRAKQAERHYIIMQRNPERERERGRLKMRLRTERLRDSPEHVTEDELRQMYEDQDGVCAYCEVPLDESYHVDHMIPLASGGTNDALNIALTCPPCNIHKGAKSLESFMATL